MRILLFAVCALAAGKFPGAREAYRKLQEYGR